MTGVLSKDDPFCMTFGKENWDNTNTQKAKHQPKHLTPKKKAKKIFEHDITIAKPRKSSQTHRKKLVSFEDLYKQNINLNVQTARKTQPHSSLTDRHPKQLMNFATIRQEMKKKYSNDKQSKSILKYGNLFDSELNKRLKEIETAAKVKIQKLRTISDSRKIEHTYGQEVMFDKYKLVNAQTTKRTKMTTINPTINRYRQEMQKLDSLINRINARIGTSNPKTTPDLVKRYTLEKA